MNSTHRVEVVPITLEIHPNAETLSIVRVWSYTVVVKTADWQGITRGAYIPPDSVVPDNETFAFLGGKTRITVRRFRGVISYGLLVPAPEGAQLGEDVAERLCVTHYEPPLQPYIRQFAGGEADKAPAGYRPRYGLEALRRYAHVLIPGEPLIATEKIHGANARYCWHDGRMHCGSHEQWKREDDHNMFWRILRATPALETFCRSHPELTVYGEVFGQVQDLKYGRIQNEVSFAAFDLLRGNEWINALEAREIAAELPWVPTVVLFDFSNMENLEFMASGKSLVPRANHLREGIVVKPLVERTHPECGRVCLKLIAPEFYERKTEKHYAK